MGVPVRKGLQERYARYDARFPLNDVYLSLPRAVRNDAYLYLLALSGHQRANEADENVPMTIAEELARVMGLRAERMLSALESVVRDGKSRVLSRTKTHVRLEKYAKWQDLPDEIAELKAKRSQAGKVGGLNSAKARTTQANAEASDEPNAQASAEANAEQPLQHQRSKPQAEREGEGEREVSLFGDKVTEGATHGASSWSHVSQVVLAGHVQGWFLNWKGWSDIKADTRRDLIADSQAMVKLRIPGDQLHEDLEALGARHDPDDVNRLSYFWQPLQDLQSERLKHQGRSQTRPDGLSKLDPHLPGLSGSKA